MYLYFPFYDTFVSATPALSLWNTHHLSQHPGMYRSEVLNGWQKENQGSGRRFHLFFVDVDTGNKMYLCASPCMQGRVTTREEEAGVFEMIDGALFFHAPNEKGKLETFAEGGNDAETLRRAQTRFMPSLLSEK